MPKRFPYLSRLAKSAFSTPHRRNVSLIIIGCIMALCTICTIGSAIYANTPAGKLASTARALTKSASLPTITVTSIPTLIPTSPKNLIKPTLTKIQPTSTRKPYATATLPSRGGDIISDHPSGTSGRCKDGTYTSAKNKQGACSHHGGVTEWWGK